MDLSPHVLAIQADLAAAAALGGEDAAEAGRALAAAVESSLQLRLLDVLTEASLALNLQLDAGHVEVRLSGREPELVIVAEAETAGEVPAYPGDDTSARITLRLPEGMKARIEAAAAREGVSANAWIVRALARAFEPGPGRARGGHRLQGFAQS